MLPRQGEAWPALSTSGAEQRVLPRRSTALYVDMGTAVLLNHFTAAEYLRGIAREGLTVGDVPTDIRKMEGRIGVWLTSAPEPNGHGLVGSLFDKKRFRIEVDIDDDAPLLARWNDWSLENVTRDTRHILSQAAARDAERDLSDTWWIYFGWIRPERIVRVTDMTTGEPVEDWATLCPEHRSVPAVPFRRKQIWQKRMLDDVRRALRYRGR